MQINLLPRVHFFVYTQDKVVLPGHYVVFNILQLFDFEQVLVPLFHPILVSELNGTSPPPKPQPTEKSRLSHIFGRMCPHVIDGFLFCDYDFNVR